MDPAFYADKTWEQTRAEARRRGRQVAAAVNREYPDITLFFHDTYSVLSGSGRISGEDLQYYKYKLGGLYAAFLDGLLESSTDETIIVDGNGNAREHSLDRFASRRLRSLHLPLQWGLTQVPEAFKKKVPTFKCPILP